jgi:CheY-like chemotaxis protein
MQWNVLVIDDDVEITRNVSELISEHKVLASPNNITCHQTASFDEAIRQMQTSRFDLMIIDLKDEQADVEISDDHEFSGERVLSELRKMRFTPVVFYSGYAHKVEHLKSPFVHIVSKGDITALRVAISSIFETRLPDLVRYIEEQQRYYLWDHIENNWGEGKSICTDSELAYLVARRLSSALSTDSIQNFISPNDPDKFMRPVELYIWPAIAGQLRFGDILKSEATSDFHIVLTPSCDCAKLKADKALLAKCVDAKSLPEYSSVLVDKAGSVAVSNTKKEALRAMIRDKRSLKGVQPERFKFLPGTNFLPDLVVDLQQLSQVAFTDLLNSSSYTRVATLDSPFAEALQNRFTQYYGRVGTPDLHDEMVLTRMLT